MDTREINVSISGSLFQLEQDDWQNVNRELRHHGLAAIELENLLTTSHASDAVVISSEMSRRLRKSILTLVRDCDRRQELIQEMIQTNNHLRDELKEQNLAVEKQESRVRDLKHALEASKQKVKNLETNQESATKILQQEEEKYNKTKSTIAATCDQLQNSCIQYQKELRSLKNKMSRMQEDTERDLHSAKLLEQLRKKASDGNLEEKVINLIDSYERQITQLKKEVSLELLPTGSSTFRDSIKSPSKKKSDLSTHKSLIKTYEKQLKDTRKNIKVLEEKNELLKLEIQARPDLSDLRDAQSKIKSLQRSLRDKNQGQSSSQQMEPLSKEDLEPNGDELLSLIREELKIEKSSEILPTLRRNAKAAQKLQEFSEELISMSRSKDNSSKRHAVWCDKTRHRTLSVFKEWSNDINAIPDLQKSLNQLSLSLISQNLFAKSSTICDLNKGVEVLLQNQLNDHIANGSHTDSENYKAIVNHFKQLFDVKSVDGIYSRMNDIYVKIGEVHSMQRNLKEILGLDEGVSLSHVIDHVAMLSSDPDPPSSRKIRELFHVDTLDEVANRIDEQEEFIAVFQPLIHRLIEVLQINTVDQILPTVKALQVLVHNQSA